MPTPRLSRPAVAAPLLLLVLLAFPARPAASEPEMAVIEVLGERPFPARLQALGPTQIEVTPAGKSEKRTVPLARVIGVRLPVAERTPTPPAAHRVTLMDGSVLLGTLSSPDEEGFQLAVRGAGTARLLFDALRSFEALPPDAGPCSKVARVHEPDPVEDVVYLRRGDDKLTGTLMDADANEVVFEDKRGRSRRVAWRDVRIMHLNNEPIEAEDGAHAEVELVDGSRFVTSKPPVLSGATIRFALRAAPKAVFTVPLERVRALRYRGGAFVYATMLPFEWTWTPFWEGNPEHYDAYVRRWNQLRVDRDRDGCPLRMGGRTWRHGFAVTSKTEIRIPLDGGSTSFSATFGIDDSVAKLGSSKAADVDVRVLADEKVLWEKKGVTLETGAVAVGPLDVTGANTLVLLVDFGKNRRDGDFATWGRPILVRK